MDDVMGVDKLSFCTGAPTEKNPEGVFWNYNGIAITKEEAMKKLKKHGDINLLDESNQADKRLLDYIDKYNQEVDGYQF